MTTLCVVPRCTPESSAEMKAAVEVTAHVITMLDHVLDRIESDEVRAHVPGMVIQFIAANIAHDAILLGATDDQRAAMREVIAARARGGFDEGLAATEAKEREGRERSTAGYRGMMIQRRPRRPRRPGRV